MSYYRQISVTFEFSRHILEKLAISNLMKILPAGAELLHADRQTDRQTDITKLIRAFHSLGKAPLNIRTCKPKKLSH